MIEFCPPRIQRNDVPAYLKAKHGIVVAKATLDGWAVKGGGPKYQRGGRVSLYPTSELDTWASNYLSPLVSISKEMPAAA